MRPSVFGEPVRLARNTEKVPVVLAVAVLVVEHCDAVVSERNALDEPEGRPTLDVEEVGTRENGPKL